MFALNVSGDPGVNLLSIIVVVSGVLLLKGYYGRLYKNKIIDTIEMFHYLNAVIFSAAKLYTLSEAKNAQTNSDYVSGTAMFALFLIVLTYHIFTESHVCMKLWKWLRQKKKRFNRTEEPLIDYPPVDSDLTDPPEPTWSSIESLSYEGKPLSAIIFEDQGQTSSRITASLSVPLLEKNGKTK